MKKIVFAIVLVLALSASAREAVSPTRIVWSTNATDVALLVSPRLGQVPEEGGLADLSGTGQQQHREEAIGGLERLAEMSVDVHAGLLFARCFLVAS